ncbi:MAG: DEAD/DEAH box helicase, partial [Chloroflexota bacterium]
TDEFVENSLWRLLKPMQDNALSSEIVTKYVVANYRSETIVELWRTQLESLPKINDIERCSFCISVPTSAGKTKVGELAILRFLLDYQNQPDKKCVYIAPLKKLCLEVEESFRNVFSQIQPGIVSAFYGYQEVDAFDDYAVRKARVLIVTPEKLDGMLRQYPDLASQIKLVIADEGHIISEANIRGYKYRFLLERLIYILDKKSLTETIKPRIVLVSGVLSHMEEFADLISGSQQNVVKIDWRPVEEPRIGTWVWNGKGFTSTDTQLPVPLPFQVNNCQSDDKFEEQVVLTAIQCAMASPTMVFSASKTVLQGKKFLDILRCIVTSHSALFPVHDPVPSELKKYSLHYALLEKGIAIHHSEIPIDIKREIEKRVINDNVRLIFASPTLAQGVNIPFDTVLVYRLHHNYYPNFIPITDSVFWNVVGRVGRPISQKRRSVSKLNSPQVLFLVNRASSATYDDKQDYRVSIALQTNGGKYRVASPFLSFLTTIKEKTNLSAAELVNELAEKQNLKDIIGTPASFKWGEMTLEQYLIMLDGQLYDLLHEAFSDVDITLDWLQQSAKKLVDLFVKASDLKADDLVYIKGAVIARLKFIAMNIPVEKRRQDYLLGLPFSDCEKVKSHTEELLSWYQGSTGMFSNDSKFGVDNLVKFMSFVADLSICRKERQSVRKLKTSNQMSMSLNDPDKKAVARNKVFQGWLSGISDSEIEKSLKVFDAKGFSQYKESVIDKIPWGISAIGRYLNAVAKEKDLALSVDLEYLPSLAKYGVNSKIACQLTRRLRITRIDAVKISNAYKVKILKVEVDGEETQSFENDFSESIKSLNMITDEELRDLSIDDETLKRIAEIREQYKYKKETINLEPEFLPFNYTEMSE